MAATIQIDFVDSDVYGRTDSSGSLLQHLNDLCISNALVAWFGSKVGDYIYQPNLGGILDRTLFKLMTPDKTAELKTFFRSEIISNFGGVLDLKNVTVAPDLTLRTYNIEISYVSKLTNKNNLVTFNTNQKPQASLVKQFLDVVYIGENLMNFILVKLPDLPGIKMIFDDITQTWTWGNFRFVNFKNTDYNFASIFNLINN